MELGRLLAGRAEGLADSALYGWCLSGLHAFTILPKTDRAFCHLDVRRMFAAAGFLRPLRVEGFLTRRIRTINGA
jgi:hypothetical protein